MPLVDGCLYSGLPGASVLREEHNIRLYMNTQCIDLSVQTTDPTSGFTNQWC